MSRSSALYFLAQAHVDPPLPAVILVRTADGLRWHRDTMLALKRALTEIAEKKFPNSDLFVWGWEGTEEEFGASWASGKHLRIEITAPKQYTIYNGNEVIA